MSGRLDETRAWQPVAGYERTPGATQPHRRLAVVDRHAITAPILHPDTGRAAHVILMLFGANTDLLSYLTWRLPDKHALHHGTALVDER